MLCCGSRVQAALAAPKQFENTQQHYSTVTCVAYNSWGELLASYRDEVGYMKGWHLTHACRMCPLTLACGRMHPPTLASGRMRPLTLG